MFINLGENKMGIGKITNAYFYSDGDVVTDHGSNYIKITVTKPEMIRHNYKLPIQILNTYKNYTNMYIEESNAGYGFIFTNEPIAMMNIYKVAIEEITWPLGFWATIVSGLCETTLKQTLANIKEFLASDQSLPVLLKKEKVIQPLYTFEQVKKLVSVIRGDLDEKYIKQILEM